MAQNMSFEAILEAERREASGLLEGPLKARPRGFSSSANSREVSSLVARPQTPVRSMLDVDGDVPRRQPSQMATNGGIASSPRILPVRSMLDIDTPLPTASSQTRTMLNINHTPPATAGSKSAQTSPTEMNHRAYITNSLPHRSLSDAASHPVGFGPKSTAVVSAYQFSGFSPLNAGGASVPKRNTQAGKKNSLTSAMAEVMKGGDFSAFGSRDRGRNSSVGGNGFVAKSRSPRNRFGLRSSSPHLTPDPSHFVLDSGRSIDMNHAYRKLSDANLLRSQGGLSSLSGMNNRRGTNGGAGTGQGGSRLEKAYVPLDGEDAVIDSSDDDYSDEEQRRGRKKDGRSDSTENDHPEGRAAAKKERKEISPKLNVTYKVRSLLDPEITVTTPLGDKLRSARSGIHPNTSFDEGASAFNTPVTSDTEAEITDIKRAQKLPISMTSVISTPATNRCVRTIYRGDFARMQQEAKENQRRVRKYLVATDLSEEAAHALEWTIGTVVRDGDTLLAIYCVDEELGIAPIDGSGDDQIKEQAAAIAAAQRPSATTPILSPVNVPSPLGQGTRLRSTSSASDSPMGRERNKAEQERHRAVQDITDRVSKLLRKTKLQVKVVIEVIHCKSPKHLITEVIDYISPTLVILGSRGRSALKGVILGSFSNYLVTKSSVPVMVARKRLRKHTKYKRPTMRLANNLSNPAVNSLAAAKID